MQEINFSHCDPSRKSSTKRIKIIHNEHLKLARQLMNFSQSSKQNKISFLMQAGLLCHAINVKSKRERAVLSLREGNFLSIFRCRLERSSSEIESSIRRRVDSSMTRETVSDDCFLSCTAFPQNQIIYLQLLVCFLVKISENICRRNLRRSHLAKFQVDSVSVISSPKLISMSIVPASVFSIFMYSRVQRVRVEMRQWLQVRFLTMKVMLIGSVSSFLRKESLLAKIFSGMLEMSLTKMGLFQYWRQIIARDSAQKLFTLQLCKRYSITFWQSVVKKNGLIFSKNLMSFSESSWLACLVSVFLLISLFWSAMTTSPSSLSEDCTVSSLEQEMMARVQIRSWEVVEAVWESKRMVGCCFCGATFRARCESLIFCSCCDRALIVDILMKYKDQGNNYMSSANTLNYLARNSRKPKHFPPTATASPLVPKPKPSRKARSISMSVPNSCGSSRVSEGMSNSCNISCGQILIKDEQKESYPLQRSNFMQKAESHAQQPRQQNNLIAEYFRRVQILEQQTKKQEELFSLKNCMNFRDDSRFDPLAQIDEEEEESICSEIDTNQSISPSSINAMLVRAKSEKIFLNGQQTIFNPQKQLKKQQKANNLQAFKSIGTQQSSILQSDRHYQKLKMLRDQHQQQQFLILPSFQREFSQIRSLKQKLCQQQKQKSTLRALNTLLKQKMNVQSYMLANKEDEQISRNRILISLLIRQLSQ